MIGGCRAFTGGHQLRLAVYVHEHTARWVHVSPREQWAWGEWICQTDEDGQVRRYRRCSGLIYGRLLRSMDRAALASLRAALVAAHGEDLVAQVETTFAAPVAA